MFHLSKFIFIGFIYSSIVIYYVHLCYVMYLTIRSNNSCWLNTLQYVSNTFWQAYRKPVHCRAASYDDSVGLTALSQIGQYKCRCKSSILLYLICAHFFSSFYFFFFIEFRIRFDFFTFVSSFFFFHSFSLALFVIFLIFFIVFTVKIRLFFRPFAPYHSVHMISSVFSWSLIFHCRYTEG